MMKIFLAPIKAIIFLAFIIFALPEAFVSFQKYKKVEGKNRVPFWIYWVIFFVVLIAHILNMEEISLDFITPSNAPNVEVFSRAVKFASSEYGIKVEG